MWNAKPPFIGEDGNPCEETVKKDFHLRGGSWGSLSTFCRSAFRYSSLRRDDRTVVSGFRVVCDSY
jgi:formylglycine-generating enzyme required for sulfatase activity